MRTATAVAARPSRRHSRASASECSLTARCRTEGGDPRPPGSVRRERLDRLSATGSGRMFDAHPVRRTPFIFTCPARSPSAARRRSSPPSSARPRSRAATTAPGAVVVVAVARARRSRWRGRRRGAARAPARDGRAWRVSPSEVACCCRRSARRTREAPSPRPGRVLGGRRAPRAAAGVACFPEALRSHRGRAAGRRRRRARGRPGG